MEVTFSGLSCVDFLVSIIINTQEDVDTHQKCDVYEIVLSVFAKNFTHLWKGTFQFFR